MPEALAVVALVVASLACLATIALYTEVGRLALRVDPERPDLPLIPNEGLEKGALVPLADLRAFPSGSEIATDREATLIVFLAANCVLCRRLWPELRKFAAETISQSLR